MSKGLVVITGASSGIGAATAKQLSEEGHPLLLIARRVEKCEELNLPKTMCAKVDVCDLKAFEEAVKKAEAEYGPTEVMVNNAGVMLLGDVASQDPSEWTTMINVNIMGVLNGIKSVINGMIERKSGTVVNVSSIAGRKGFPNHAVYCATKFGVHALTETIREETAKHNLRFVTIAPGVVETELLGHTTSEEIVSGYKDWKNTIEVLTPEDIARSISFAVHQPQHVCIREIVIGPTKQAP
mmetsp:Transcript_20204/g.34393  ORF Transcript_20204/g.34393 Transcript_20204/m.34393 type:complete len:240 (+) Transcript_20204:61-780(+)